MGTRLQLPHLTERRMLLLPCMRMGKPLPIWQNQRSNLGTETQNPPMEDLTCQKKDEEIFPQN